MTLEDRLRGCLAELYGRPAADAAWNKLARLLDQFLHTPLEASARFGRLSEKDAILITYGDQFRCPGQPPLQTLAEFVDDWLGEALGGIHILPFYPYSSDDGFSVVDYRRVDPELGEWSDVARLSRARRLMFDGVLNHVSQHSVWFQAFLQGEEPYTRYFITPGADWDLEQVVRPRTLPLLSEFETAAGPRRVWTTFSADQIDLNYANPDVLLEMIAVLLFYVERGASILRLDAIAYLWKEPGTTCIHLENTHRVIKILRLVLDMVAPHVLLISETNVPHADNISYFGQADPLTGRSDEAQLVYQFPLAPLILHSFAAGDASRLTQWAASLGNAGLFFNFTASHDGIGILPARGLLTPEEEAVLVQSTLAHGGQVSYKSNPDGSQSPYELNITFYDALNDPAHPDPDTALARFMASQTIMLSLAGVPGVYVHSLFGSHNCLDCVEATGRARSINREKFDYPALRLELEQGQSRRARVFAAYRRLLIERGRQPAFHPHGAQQVLNLHPAVFALLRLSPDGRQPLVSLVNVSAQPQRLWIDLAALSLPEDCPWRDCLGGQEWRSEDGRLDVNLESYQAAWLAPAASLRRLEVAATKTQSPPAGTKIKNEEKLSMDKAVVFTQPCKIEIQDYEPLPLGPKQVRVRTLYSGISAGTEMSAYRGTNPFITRRFDPQSRLFLPEDAPSMPYPLVGWGYEEVGKITEIGAEVTRLKVGEIVYGTWGHRTGHVLEEEFAFQRRKPEALDPILAIYSHIGPIAINGILDANIHIGETVAVFGLGVLGQVICQLAKASGATVYAVDLIEKRRKLALELGAVDAAFDPRDGSPAEKIKALTGRGADVSIEISGSHAALHEAIRTAAYAARVVALGFYQGEAAGLRLGEEFHHNRIQLICSQIGNVDPAFSQRWDRLRLVHTTMDLQVRGLLNLRPVITHVLPFERAAEAFELLDKHPEDALQVVLDFGH